MLIRLLNLLGLLGVSLVLLAAFYYQLFQNELPCPLCLLQRGCFVALGIGFALNLSVGPSRLHDAMMLVSGLLGAGTALRQMAAPYRPGRCGLWLALVWRPFLYLGLCRLCRLDPLCRLAAVSSRRARAALAGGRPKARASSAAWLSGSSSWWWGAISSRPCSNAASAPAPTIRPSTSGWVPGQSERCRNLRLASPGHPLGG